MAAPQAPSSKSRAVVFAVTALALAALAWIVFAGLRAGRAPLAPAKKIPNDLEEGAQVKLPKVDLAGAPVKPGGGNRILLVALPGCGDCTKDEFDPDKINMGRFDRVILLSSGRVLLNKYGEKYKNLHLELVPDSNDQAANALNAVFKPRAYILNSDFTIKAAQGSNQTVADFANGAG